LNQQRLDKMNEFNNNPKQNKNVKPNNKPFIPLAKQSKQKQKAYHSSNRTTWGALNPITRKPPNPKAYKRKSPGQPIND